MYSSLRAMVSLHSNRSSSRRRLEGALRPRAGCGWSLGSRSRAALRDECGCVCACAWGGGCGGDCREALLAADCSGMPPPPAAPAESGESSSPAAGAGDAAPPLAATAAADAAPMDSSDTAATPLNGPPPCASRADVCADGAADDAALIAGSPPGLMTDRLTRAGVPCWVRRCMAEKEPTAAAGCCEGQWSRAIQVQVQGGSLAQTVEWRYRRFESVCGGVIVDATVSATAAAAAGDCPFQTRLCLQSSLPVVAQCPPHPWIIQRRNHVHSGWRRLWSLPGTAPHCAELPCGNCAGSIR